ncbi:LLM class flavin-dependent oxidoreductase [Pseudonocardia zijingensis]|jgi:alkanesulfonate monooxygenase SsuD/methylene tetrahydromethanopterin reductase-like flavin-dependent oxidoreductase (luciferase family)|uniref:LLM class flavin-dependent oxidoreductase n=1 Tax=Pseudonocardia zijingensis TaxID=153376 RepID=A0ABN1NBV6_9PSEU
MALFGIGLDTGFNGAVSGIRDAGHLLAQARNADRDGLDVVTMTDHPYSPAQFDAYATLGFVLGATTSVTAVSTVTNLPCRPAPMLAKMASGLSDLSGGRFALGVGAGALWDEIVKLGVERRTPAEAVRLFDESITLVKLLTGGGEPVTFEGEFHRVEDLPPSDAPTPPIWSGSIGPRSLGVTGRLADVWVPGAAQDWRSRLVATSRAVIDEAAAGAGRNPADIATVYNVLGRITDAPLPTGDPTAGSTTGSSLDELLEASVRDPGAPAETTRSADGTWVGGSVEQWVEELTIAVRDHGAGGFVFFPVADTPEDAEKARARWAREIVPAVREATAA